MNDSNPEPQTTTCYDGNECAGPDFCCGKPMTADDLVERAARAYQNFEDPDDGPASHTWEELSTSDQTSAATLDAGGSCGNRSCNQWRMNTKRPRRYASSWWLSNGMSTSERQNGR